MPCRIDGRICDLLTETRIDNKGQIRAAHSLVSIIHSMKLLLLLSDESQIANRRDAEIRHVQAERVDLQKQVAALLNELLYSPKSRMSAQDASNSMDTS